MPLHMADIADQVGNAVQKARECPPTPLAERDKFDLNTGWLSTANGPMDRNAHAMEAVRIAFQIPSAQKTTITAVLSLSHDYKLVCFREDGWRSALVQSLCG